MDRWENFKKGSAKLNSLSYSLFGLQILSRSFQINLYFKQLAVRSGYSKVGRKRKLK